MRTSVTYIGFMGVPEAVDSNPYSSYACWAVPLEGLVHGASAAPDLTVEPGTLRVPTHHCTHTHNARSTWLDVVP